MGLLALCYPKLAERDRQFIDEFRQQHDRARRGVVPPHFTMVFPVEEFSEAVFSEHVARVASASRPLSFTCRYAMVHDAGGSDDYHVFLVPDEGFSELALLHDALYTSLLVPHLRLDIPYVPHLGIATLKDSRRCKALADELNAKRRLCIGGEVDEISVVAYDGNAVTDLRRFRLGIP